MQDILILDSSDYTTKSIKKILTIKFDMKVLDMKYIILKIRISKTYDVSR
jgi:hypothetical protein